MGLDFTNIKDRPGAAIYFIHDGTSTSQREFERLIEDVKSRTSCQTTLLSARDHNGQQIIKFYGLRGTKFVIIVRDDDQLHHVWSDGELFDASRIAYSANQAG